MVYVSFKSLCSVVFFFWRILHTHFHTTGNCCWRMTREKLFIVVLYLPTMYIKCIFSHGDRVTSERIDRVSTIRSRPRFIVHFDNEFVHFDLLCEKNKKFLISKLKGEKFYWIFLIFMKRRATIGVRWWICSWRCNWLKWFARYVWFWKFLIFEIFYYCLVFSYTFTGCLFYDLKIVALLA